MKGRPTLRRSHSYPQFFEESQQTKPPSYDFHHKDAGIVRASTVKHISSEKNAFTSKFVETNQLIISPDVVKLMQEAPVKNGKVEIVEDYVPESNIYEASERISESTGPRVLFLTDKKRPRLCIPGTENLQSAFAMGCGGDKGPAQLAVAALMYWFTKAHPELFIRYVINLGDNFYSTGVDSPVSADFNRKFYNIYYGGTLSGGQSLDINFHISLGNHDGNYRRQEHIKQNVAPYIPSGIMSYIHKPTGRNAEKNIIMHNYLNGPVLTSNISKAKLYTRTFDRKKPQHTQMDLSEAAAFDIPYYFCSRVVNDVFQLFYINSNTLPQDFLAYLRHRTKIKPLKKDELQKNQFFFLYNEYLDCDEADRIPIAILHHPLIALNKRFYEHEYDSVYYQTSEDTKRLDLILQLPDFGTAAYFNKVEAILRSNTSNLRYIQGIPEPTVDAGSYNIQLTRLFACLDMKFRVVVCAHDHLLAYINTEGFAGVSFNKTWDGKNKYKINPERPDNPCKFPIRQITSGGAGGELQDRLTFKQPKESYYVEENGTFILTFDKAARSVDIHLVTTLTEQIIVQETKDQKFIKKTITKPGLHLRFSDKNASPIQSFAQANKYAKESENNTKSKEVTYRIQPLSKVNVEKPVESFEVLQARLIHTLNFATDILCINENEDEKILSQLKTHNAKHLEEAINQRKSQFTFSQVQRRNERKELTAKINSSDASDLDFIEGTHYDFRKILDYFVPKNLGVDEFNFRMGLINDFITKSGGLSLQELDNLIKLEVFRCIILIAVTEYQNFLDDRLTQTHGHFFSPSKNMTHPHSEAVRINSILNYVSQYQPTSFNETVLTVYDLLDPLRVSPEKMSLESKMHSFYISLNEKLKCSDVLEHMNMDALKIYAEQEIAAVSQMRARVK